MIFSSGALPYLAANPTGAVGFQTRLQEIGDIAFDRAAVHLLTRRYGKGNNLAYYESVLAHEK